MEKLPIKIPNATTIFSKPLKKTDRESQLIVPTGVLQQFPIPEPAYERDFTAFDKKDRQWHFTLAIRQTAGNNEKYYEKPFLRPPMWHAFVEAHGLSGSDGHEYGVIFYIKNDEPNKLQVSGLRKYSKKLMGKEVWEEV